MHDSGAAVVAAARQATPLMLDCSLGRFGSDSSWRAAVLPGKGSSPARVCCCCKSPAAARLLRPDAYPIPTVTARIAAHATTTSSTAFHRCFGLSRLLTPALRQREAAQGGGALALSAVTAPHAAERY